MPFPRPLSNGLRMWGFYQVGALPGHVLFSLWLHLTWYVMYPGLCLRSGTDQVLLCWVNGWMKGKVSIPLRRPTRTVDWATVYVRCQLEKDNESEYRSSDPGGSRIVHAWAWKAGLGRTKLEQMRRLRFTFGSHCQRKRSRGQSRDLAAKNRPVSTANPRSGRVSA